MSDVTLLAEVAAFLRQPHGQFIAGEALPGNGPTLAVINPATGKAIAGVTSADVGQADRAMASASQAFDSWRAMPTLQRGTLLLRLADLLASHREELAQLESLCSGKTIGLARMLELDQSVAFLRYFAGWAGKVTGSPLDEQTLMGPLANRVQFEKVLQLIEKAREEGDTIVCGGEALPGDGYFVLPTAVKVRSENSTLMQEETFGPVCSFIGYQSEEEALSRINASPFGLAASVWSENIRKALRYSDAINAGIVWVNMHTFLDPAVPFGGMKGSGIGREFGSAFIDDYTELKSVMVRY